MCKSVDDLKSVIKHQTPCIKYQSQIYIIYRQNVLTLKKNTTIIPTCIFTNYICIFSCCKLYFTIFLVVNTRYSRHSVGSVAYKTQNAQNIFVNIIALYIYKKQLNCGSTSLSYIGLNMFGFGILEDRQYGLVVFLFPCEVWLVQLSSS